MNLVINLSFGKQTSCVKENKGVWGVVGVGEGFVDVILMSSVLCFLEFFL